MRVPVAAKIALVRAGPIPGVPGSPAPPMGLPLDSREISEVGTYNSAGTYTYPVERLLEEAGEKEGDSNSAPDPGTQENILKGLRLAGFGVLLLAAVYILYKAFQVAF